MSKRSNPTNVDPEVFSGEEPVAVRLEPQDVALSAVTTDRLFVNPEASVAVSSISTSMAVSENEPKEDTSLQYGEL
jgi:hypothetical protein